MSKTNFKRKKVLILGLGVNQGGVGAARFFAHQGALVRVTDLKSREELKESLEKLKDFGEIEYVLGEHREEDIDWADLIIRNPAIRPDNKYLKLALEKGKQVEMDLGIFLEFVRKDQIIGVTGTKGKSTTASLINVILASAASPESRLVKVDSGQAGMTGRVILAGNIGRSVLDIVPLIEKDSLIILELSSFQLQAFEQHKFSPKYAVITNIYEDHLNYHGSMESYIEAKKAICKFQTGDDFMFLNQDSEILSSTSFSEDLKGQKIFFSSKDLDKEYKPKLLGEHNRANIAAALRVAQVFNIPQEEALKAVQDFAGVEFRMQLIFDKEIKIYNDTTATSPQAAIQALNTFNSPILIVGGVDKDLDYEELAHQIDRKVKAVFFLEGNATEKIRQHLKHQRILRSTYSDLETLLRAVRSEAKKGDVVLFSPGAASFNLFQNEFDRGRKFNEAVRKVFRSD